jgi:hypothetical protein
MRTAILIDNRLFANGMTSRWFSRQGITQEEYYHRENMSVFILDPTEFPSVEKYGSFRLDSFDMVITLTPDDRGNPKAEILKSVTGNIGDMEPILYSSDTTVPQNIRRTLMG